MYAVKINTISKDPKIHKYPCSEIKKNGGIGSYNQVKWKDYDTLEEAEMKVETTIEGWIKKGYKVVKKHKREYYCKKCMFNTCSLIT